MYGPHIGPIRQESSGIWRLFFREGDDGDDNSLIADREVDHLTNGVHNGEKIDSQSHISDSTCTIDIDRDNEDKTKLDEGKIIS